MEWPRYCFSVEPYKTPEEMARIDPAYSPSSSAVHSPIYPGTPSSSNASPAQTPGWRLGACLPAHLSYFAQSTVKQDPPLFHPTEQPDHCLFTEQRPSPLPPGYAASTELFCSCSTCYRVLMGFATAEETEAWRAARERWRKRKEQGWKELQREREEAALAVVELEMLRARRVVAEALNLTEEEMHEWEYKGEKRWKERAREEAYVRDESLRDGNINSEPASEP
ncbi:hypothetical protein NMY22_g17745 [Coprinellus aureogranulatus]|nr:hypothetical protein NMY22_g17745 [Coprinellus aureogranulatus]